jgi:RHS repeat-associated protein
VYSLLKGLWSKDYGMTTVETYYAWDGGMTLAEYSPHNGNQLKWQKSFIYLGGRLLATESGAGAYQYHHPDRLGTRLITNSGGSIISEQIHLPYGTALTGESVSYGSSANPSKKRFTSYERSEGTKLDHAVNRQYHAGLGRFTQVDPIGMGAVDIGDPQSLNLYAYCGNDPINHTDPQGLFFKKLFSAFGKALRFLFKVIAVVLAIAVLAAGSPGGVLILLGLAAVFGIAGWHNGKLGNFVRTLLLAGGANSKHGGFRTPPTFGNGGSAGVNGFLQTDNSRTVNLPQLTITRLINGRRFGLYKTIDEAAKAAISYINPISQENRAEYGGSICKTKDGYFIFTPPATSSKEDSVDDTGICPGEAWEVVAYYHTHPKIKGRNYDSENFSPAHFNPVTQKWEGDVAFANALQRPFYLGTPSMRIKVYDPLMKGKNKVKIVR